MQITYGMRMTADKLFFSKLISIVHRASFLLLFCVMFVCQNFLLCCAEYQSQTYSFQLSVPDHCLSFYFTVRKIETIQLWHFVSSVAQKT